MQSDIKVFLFCVHYKECFPHNKRSDYYIVSKPNWNFLHCKTKTVTQALQADVQNFAFTMEYQEIFLKFWSWINTLSIYPIAVKNMAIPIQLRLLILNINRWFANDPLPWVFQPQVPIIHVTAYCNLCWIIFCSITLNVEWA